ncbi:MAG: hypothetical protein NZ601_05140, partial [candidate division WOR-3 bacterium]|nr:hypothetical protein [candidate division WOR-3 bacterium]
MNCPQKFILKLLVVTNLLAYATGDRNLTINSCGNHPTGGRATIYFNPNIPSTVSIAQEIAIGVILKLGPTTNRLAGVMLVNGSGLLPSQDGWAIIQDPNRNPSPYNYNEKSNLQDSTVFLWILRAPTTIGARQLRAKLFYGDNGAKSKEATPITINVLPMEITENQKSTSMFQLKLLTSNIVKNQLEITTQTGNFDGFIEIYNTLGKSVMSP